MGVSQQLLRLVVNRLNEQGYTHLGVDFESINPAADRFWLKHFEAYSCVVARRIDECAVTNK
jgi:hypothetical protein